MCSGRGDGAWERTCGGTGCTVGSTEDVVEGLLGEGATAGSLSRLVGRAVIVVGGHCEDWVGFEDR